MIQCNNGSMTHFASFCTTETKFLQASSTRWQKSIRLGRERRRRKVTGYAGSQAAGYEG